MNPRARFESTCLFRHWISAVLLLVLALLTPLSLAAQQEPTSKRKLVNHAAAPYPALARSMALAGVVKVEAVVNPDGTVKALDVKGGHPVLVQDRKSTRLNSSHLGNL